MARILIVHPGPEFSVHDVYRGWEKALRKQGHEVMTYNTNHRLMAYGSSWMPDYPEGWEGTRALPTCPTCAQQPYKKAYTDDQVKTLAIKGVFELAYTFWPDIIFFVSGFFFDDATLQVLNARRHKLVILHTESPYQDEEQMKRGANVHLNLINDPANLAEWRSTVGSTYYLPHAYDPDIHYPHKVADLGIPRSYQADFAFVGTAFKSRRDFFGRLGFRDMHRDGLRLAIGGGGWGEAADEPENAHLLDFLGHHPEMCVDNDETANVYRTAKVGLNLYRREGENEGDYSGWAMGPREVEMAACGLFFLRDPRPESDELFGDILPAFSGPEEASELIRRWASPSRNAQREILARKAREQVADRTFDASAARFMQYMDEAGLTV